MADETSGTRAEVRQIARETYCKMRIGRPYMPHPDYAEGQQKIDLLFDILWKPFCQEQSP